MNSIPPRRDRAVCLLSGGQDSTTCLYWALREFEEVAALSFDYGQRHRIELEAATAIAESVSVEHETLSLRALAMLGGSTLTNRRIANVGQGAERNRYAEERGLPPSFTPGRNVLFFGLAAAWGLPRGFPSLVTGVCAQDRAGYPDCRREFVEAMQSTLRIGLDDFEFTIEAPLLERDKAATWALADELGVLDQIVELTRTCYEGDDENRHPWGYGCGECGACLERARGWERFQSVEAA